MTHRPLNQPDDYLSAIWVLTSPIGERAEGRRKPTAPAAIARLLGVSRPTAGDMLGKLEDRGLVERGERKEALLTDAGRRRAMQAVRRYRLVATFLVEKLGYTPWQSVEHTGRLADGFDDDAVERLYDFLGRPERSPHGFPIDPDHELRENTALTLAHRAQAGVQAEVIRIWERNVEAQERLLGSGIAPGARVLVEQRGRSTILAGDGQHIELDHATASGVYLRPDGVPAVPATATCWADILRREHSLARPGSAR